MVDALLTGASTLEKMTVFNNINNWPQVDVERAYDTFIRNKSTNSRPSTTKMSEENELPVDKLKKIMGQTTSDNDNIKLMAINMANKFLADNGWTWDRLLEGKIKIAANPFGNLRAPPATKTRDREAAAPPPPPPKPKYRDLDGYFHDTIWERDNANKRIQAERDRKAAEARRKAAAEAAKPKIFPTIGSQHPNKFANNCHCCGDWVDQYVGFIFKPSDHNTAWPKSKWAVVCKTCNNKVGLTVTSYPAPTLGRGPAKIDDLA